MSELKKSNLYINKNWLEIFSLEFSIFYLYLLIFTVFSRSSSSSPKPEEKSSHRRERNHSRNERGRGRGRGRDRDNYVQSHSIFEQGPSGDFLSHSSKLLRFSLPPSCFRIQCCLYDCSTLSKHFPSLQCFLLSQSLFNFFSFKINIFVTFLQNIFLSSQYRLNKPWKKLIIFYHCHKF